MLPIPTTTAPNFLTISITSKTDPPVVTTSSQTKTFSPLDIENPRRKVISLFSLSVKIDLLFNWRATSYPTIIPPIAGAITVSIS